MEADIGFNFGGLGSRYKEQGRFEGQKHMEHIAGTLHLTYCL